MLLGITVFVIAFKAQIIHSSDFTNKTQNDSSILKWQDTKRQYISDRYLNPARLWVDLLSIMVVSLMQTMSPRLINISTFIWIYISSARKHVTAIMMLYRKTKVKLRSQEGDTDYFDIAAGVQQGDALAPYLFIICMEYVLRTSLITWKTTV